jgi:hypothetical protein
VLLAAVLSQALPVVPAQTVRMATGESTVISLGFRPTQTICDDLSVVSVQPRGDIVELTGRKPGRTLCSFWYIAGQRLTYEIEVLPR